MHIRIRKSDGSIKELLRVTNIGSCRDPRTFITEMIDAHAFQYNNPSQHYFAEFYFVPFVKNNLTNYECSNREGDSAAMNDMSCNLTRNRLTKPDMLPPICKVRTAIGYFSANSMKGSPCTDIVARRYLVK